MKRGNSQGAVDSSAYKRQPTISLQSAYTQSDTISLQSAYNLDISRVWEDCSDGLPSLFLNYRHGGPSLCVSRLQFCFQRSWFIPSSLNLQLHRNKKANPHQRD